MSVIGDIFLGLFYQNWSYLLIVAAVILVILGRFFVSRDSHVFFNINVPCYESVTLRLESENSR